MAGVEFLMAYHRPPDDYEPPTHCEQCGGMIMFGPVIGGRIWMHIIRADHDVIMRDEGWWDVSLGVTRYGSGTADLLM